ncbi:MAG: hypothetical protein RLP14_09740 [Owenweeksia sp.]
MKLSPKNFNGFLLACLAGIIYSVIIYGLFYKPTYKTGHKREFSWTSPDTTYNFKLRSPAVFQGYFTHPDSSGTSSPSSVKLEEENGWFFLNTRPNLLTWILLFILFNSFCFGAASYLRYIIPDTYKREDYNKQLLKVIGLSLLCILMVALLSMGLIIPKGQVMPPFRLWHMFPEVFQPSEPLMLLIQFPAYTLGLICVFSMILTGNVSIQNWGKNVEEVQQRLSNINRLSHHLLVILSTVLVITILTTYFMFKATQENVNGPIAILFPERILILYGSIFTFFIFLLYLPTYFKVQQLNEEAFTYARSNKMDEETISSTSEKMLQFTNPRLLLTIASPVITSLFPSLVELLS